MILGVLFSLAGIGLFVLATINLAVFALPAFVGAELGILAYRGGAGLPGAIAVGLIAGVATLVVGQIVFARSRNPALRLAVAAVFTVPAAIAGYHLVLGLSRIGGAHGAWQTVFAGLGALAIGGAALQRLLAPVGDGPVLIGAPQPRGGLRISHGR
jgi:hypothetical protein